MEKEILLSDIIKNQAIINVGCIGHVSNGKSTLVKQMTGVKTQKFKSEQERNITINVGYANCKIFHSDKTGEYSYCSSDISKQYDSQDNEMKLIHHISFVDCPGHENYMSNMLSGASIIDMAFLVEAANAKIVPQPQTLEHFVAIQNTSIKDIVVIQNKCDLVTKDEIYSNKDKIDQFTEDFMEEPLPVIPVIAQTGSNIEYVGKYLANNLTDYNKNLNEKLQINLIRTFDINKAYQPINTLKGGVLGGTIVSGILNKGDIIQISPGICNLNSENNWVVTPLYTKVETIFSEKNSLDFAIPGGLIGIGTGLDPSFCKSNNLVGQIISRPNENLDIAYMLYLDCKIFKRISKDNKILRRGDILKLGILSKNIQGAVLEAKKNKITVKLGIPCCINNQTISIMKKIEGQYKLFGIAKILKSKNVEIERKYDTVQQPLYKIKNNLINDNGIECFDYDAMLNSLNHKYSQKITLNIPKPIISKSSNRLQQVVVNYVDLINSQINSDDKCDFKQLFEKYIAEMCNTNVNVNGSGQLLINDRKIDKVKVQRKIIDTFIKLRKCKVCGSYSSYLHRQDRMIKLFCKVCQSEHTIL